MSLGLICTAGFVLLAVWAALLFLRSKNRALWFPLLWSVALSCLLNAASFAYYAATGDDFMFVGLPIDAISMGLLINVVYLACWIAGYATYLNSVPKRAAAPPADSGEEVVTLVLLVMALGATAWMGVQDYGYGYGQRLYAESLTQVGAYGIYGSISRLAGPAAAALLLFALRRRDDRRGPPWLRSAGHLWFLGVALGGMLLVGLVLTMKRGRIAEVVFLIIFLMVLRGLTRRAVFILLIATCATALISPILDFARSGRGGGSAAALAQGVEQRLTESGAGPSGIVYEIARKSLLPVSSAAMYLHTRDTGHPGLKTYSSVLVDQIPRVLYPNKPYPLSVDGTASGTPGFIVGRVLGLPGVTFWEAGGAVMHWQFGWFGVVLGGLIVGALWAVLCRESITRGSVLLLVLFLAMPSWGSMFGQSLDFLLDRVLSLGRVLAPFWLAAVLLPRSVRATRALHARHLSTVVRT